jgi:6-phosphofructokinase 1
MSCSIDILASGGDCPGLNAALRAVARAVWGRSGMRGTGSRNGVRGPVQNQPRELKGRALQGILTECGTVLGSCFGD